MELIITRAARDVMNERQRQKEGEGFDESHDDKHEYGELAIAAAAYAIPRFELFPWNMYWWKPTTRRRNLVKAGALILAEIERLDRAG